MSFKKSHKLYNKGLEHLVGAVNSPVRAFASVGGNPLFIKKAKGSKNIPSMTKAAIAPLAPQEKKTSPKNKEIKWEIMFATIPPRIKIVKIDEPICLSTILPKINKTRTLLNK